MTSAMTMQGNPQLNLRQAQLNLRQAQPKNAPEGRDMGAMLQNAMAQNPMVVRPIVPQQTNPPLPDSAKDRAETSAASVEAIKNRPRSPYEGAFGVNAAKKNDAAVRPEVLQGNLTLEDLSKLRAQGYEEPIRRAIDRVQATENDENSMLAYRQRRIVEAGQNKYADAVALANVTPEDFRRQQDLSAEDAQLFDPRSQNFQNIQQGQGTIYDRLLSTATGAGPTAGQMQLEAQYARGSNQARQNAMQAALASGASPAAAARAASMASEQFTRGLGDQIAGTGMQERLAYLDAAGQFGQSQQNADFGRYAQMRNMEQAMLAAEQSQSMDILGMQNTANQGYMQNSYNQRMADIAQQNADTARKQANASIGMGIAGAVMKGASSFMG